MGFREGLGQTLKYEGIAQHQSLLLRYDPDDL